MIDPSELDTAEFPLPQTDERVRPSSSLVHVDIAALSDKGKKRETNQDHFLVARAGRHLDTLLSNLPEGALPARFDETGYIALVADGMGGAAGGEVASRLYSLVLSCKHAGADPEAYLEDVLVRVSTTPAREIASLTPWAWAKTRQSEAGAAAPR